MTKKTTKSSTTSVTTRKQAKKGPKQEEEASTPKWEPKSVARRRKALPPKGQTPVWIKYYEQEAKDPESAYGKGYRQPDFYYDSLMEEYVDSEDHFYDTLNRNPEACAIVYADGLGKMRIFHHLTAEVHGNPIIVGLEGFGSMSEVQAVHAKLLIAPIDLAESENLAIPDLEEFLWRRWKGFCNHTGLHHHSDVYSLPSSERELILRGFLTAIRTAQWDRSGRITGTRKVPVASATVRSTTSHLATAFRIRFERSPLHIEGTNLLRPTFRDLLTAFDNVDPPPKRQTAVTPRFLRALFTKSTTKVPLVQHAADLLVGAFFFACRSCEYVVTPSPGVTRRLKLRDIVFHDARHQLLHHSDPHLASRAAMVTLCFENQKNRTQMDRRTHTRTSDPILCPVKRFVSIVHRVLQTIPNAGPNTDICTVLDGRLQVVHLDNSFTLALLRATATSEFGFKPSEIGNRSIRSGAAMALFMTKTLPDRIMLLGRWKSLAFMAYIRPQVLQWSNQMATDMIHFDHFFASPPPTSDKPPLTPHSDTPHQLHHNGRPIKIESFNVDFENNINISS